VSWRAIGEIAEEAIGDDSWGPMIRSLISNAKLTKLARIPVVDSIAPVLSAPLQLAILLLLVSKRESDSGQRFEPSRFQFDVSGKIVLH